MLIKLRNGKAVFNDRGDGYMYSVFVRYKKKFKNMEKIFYAASPYSDRLIVFDPLGDEKEYRKYFRTLNNINKHFQKHFQKN